MDRLDGLRFALTGDGLKHTLRIAKKTKYRVAKDTGISYATIHKWGRCQAVPRKHTIKKVAKYLGLDLGDLAEAIDKTPEHSHLLSI